MDTNIIKEQLTVAFNEASQIDVHGNGAILMAQVLQRLQAVYKMIEDAEKEIESSEKHDTMMGKGEKDDNN